VREIAADEPEDDEEDVDAEPATRRVNGITVSPYAVSVPAPKYAAPKEDEAEVDPCPTPPNETRVDPRTRYLDAEERHLRRMGRRCASGAALVAAQKRALREGTAAATEDAPAALPAVAA
jgi:hypothetical protein